MGTTTYHCQQDNSHLVKQAEERMQRESHRHQQRMKELENADKERKRRQKRKNIAHITQIISQLDSSVKGDQALLKTAQEDKSRYGSKKSKLRGEIENFWDSKKETLNAFKTQLGLDGAEQDYKRDYNEIRNAIETTGQHHGDVGKFLKLTLSLIGATMNTSAEANKLDVALATFGTIMNDECQDKLTIDSYFNEQNLERFIPILAKEGYKTLQHLICDDDVAFEEDILTLLENGICEAKEAKETDEKAPVRLQREGDGLCKFLLKKWNLSQYWDKLADDGWDDAEDWNELCRDADILSEVIDKKGHRNKFIKQCKKWKEGDTFSSLKQMERSQLRKICLKPEYWKQIENEKISITKAGLLQLSPILADFFGKMNGAVIQISALLAYKNELSDIQLNAVKMRKENNQKLKAITFRKLENEQRRKWSQNSQCEIYSASSKQWFLAKIVEIKRDDEGEWLNVEYVINNEIRNKQIERYADAIKPIAAKLDAVDVDNEKEKEKEKELDDDEKDTDMDIQRQCGSLITASIIGINVTDSMVSAFNSNSVTLRGLTLAAGVEGACMRIICGQGQIRQSVFLAQEILQFKPANMSSDKTKALWTAIDGGIIQIFKSALEMAKVSAQYFAFFLRFQSSFQFYISCYRNNADTKLMISLERLKKDVRDFNAFTATFSNKIEALSATTMNCIEDCVKTQIGVKNWESARNSLEITEKRYLTLQRQYDQKGFALDNELDKKKQNRIHFEQKEAGAIYEVNMLDGRIKQNNDYLRQCQTALAQLEAVLI